MVFYQSQWAYDPQSKEAQEFILDAEAIRNDLERNTIVRPPIAYSFQAFRVFPARTVIGNNPRCYILGIPKTFIAEFCEQNPEYVKADDSAIALRIFKLKENEITARLGEIAPGFIIEPAIIESFTLPPALPSPEFYISNGRLPVWNNQQLKARLSNWKL